MSLLAYVQNRYPIVKTGRPVLVGHVLKKFIDKDLSMRSIQEWATMENTQNGYPPITNSIISKLKLFFRKRHNLHSTTLKKECKIKAHKCVRSTTTNTTSTTTTTTSQIDTKSTTVSSASASVTSPTKIILLKELKNVKRELLFLKQKLDHTKRQWHARMSNLKKKLADAENKLQISNKNLHLLQKKVREANNRRSAKGKNHSAKMDLSI